MRKRNAWLGLRLLPGALIVLGAGAPVAAGATIVRDDTIVGDVTHDFEAVPLGVLPTLSLPGATYGERFAGQTLLGGALWDVLLGAPTPPLTLLPGAPNQSLIVIELDFPQPHRSLVGCGPAGACPSGESAGEGAVSILFAEDVLVFGFEVEGAGQGDVSARFFSRSGADLGSFTVQATETDFLGFRVTSGAGIAGVSLTNLDAGGVAFDDVTFSTVPEPSTALLLLLGLAGLRRASRRDVILASGRSTGARDQANSIRTRSEAICCTISVSLK